MRRPPARTGRLLLTVLAGGALLLALLLRSRGGDDNGTAPQPRLQEGVSGAVQQIDPLAGRQTPAERTLSALIFAGLTRPGPDGAPLPALAERWQVDRDSKLFTFTLRSGLSWHDGQPITSTDVLFTVQALAAREATSDPALWDLWSTARLTALGEARVQVELAAPYAPLPAYAAFGLLPAHLLRDVPLAEWEQHPFFRAPTGSGPFRLRRLTETLAELDAFPGYALGPPYLPGIDLHVNQPPETQYQRLLSGELTAALLPGGDHRVPARSLTRSAHQVVLLNHADPLLADARVRLALSHAVDRGALAQEFGGVPADTPFAPGWWVAAGEPAMAQDLGSAGRWLTEAGYHRSAGDNLLTSGGLSVALRLLSPAEGNGPAIAAAVAAAWRVLGIQVTVEALPTETLVQQRLMPGAFQAAVAGWDPGPDPDPFGAWHSSRRGEAAGNFGAVADAELDRLAEQGRVEAGLPARRAVYAAFAARFRVYTPGIVLFAERWQYAVSAALQAPLQAAATEADRFGQVHLWRVVTGQR